MDGIAAGQAAIRWIFGDCYRDPGYEDPGVTVAEIAKALGVGRGTVYRALQQTP
jgi:DNA invertase Pin-like site-specific DNA recombinase